MLYRKDLEKKDARTNSPMYKQHDNQHDNQLLPRNYYTFTLQKVHSCNAKGIQLQQRSNAFTTRQIFKGSSDDFERLEGNQ